MRFIPPQMDDVDDDLVNWEVPENRLIFAVILLAVADCSPRAQSKVGKAGHNQMNVQQIMKVMSPKFLDRYFKEDVRDLCEQIANPGKEKELYNQILKAKKTAEMSKSKSFHLKPRLMSR